MPAIYVPKEWPRSGCLAGVGEIEVGWVSRDACVHVENVFHDLGRTKGGMRERSRLWARGLHSYHYPRSANVGGRPELQYRSITFQAETLNLQIVPDGIKLACPRSIPGFTSICHVTYLTNSAWS